MKSKTKRKLQESQKWCDDNDKSTEFMLQYMRNFAEVDLICVLKFLEKDWGVVVKT